MDFFKSIQTVDTHTVGQSTRIVLAGVPALRGNSIMEKKNYLIKHYDYIRSCIMMEPRGHADMFGAFIIEPIHSDADFGMIFMDGKGYLNMCGHGTIGVATVLVDTGMVKVTEPYTELVLDSAVGMIKARVLVENRRIKNSSFINVPSFLFQRDVVLDVPELGTLKFDIAFGGNFFIIIKDSELGVEISPYNTPAIIYKAMKLLNYAMEHVPVNHPLLPINKIELVEIYGQPKNKDANCQNIVVFGDGQVDRSPCGTGTCAKMAVLYAKGELAIGEDFVHESVLETTLTGCILNKTRIGNFEAIIPQITGSAYITGFNNLVINQDDPLKFGFRLSK